MSGRIRSIKPEIHDDVPACSLSDAAWRLWVGAWPIADDDGRFKAEPLYLSTRIWMGTPDRDGRPRDALFAATALLELTHAGFVKLYRAPSGELYGEVKQHAWRAHQRIERPSKWRNPVPNETAYLGPTLPEPSRLLTDYSPTTHRGLGEGSPLARARSGSGSGSGSGPGPGSPPEGARCPAEAPPSPPEPPPGEPAGIVGPKRVKPKPAKPDPERFGAAGETAAQVAWRCWLETYRASHRRHGEYTRDPADGKHMVSLAKHGLELARERAGKLGEADVAPVLEALFRFWFRAYLRDDGSKAFALADVKHGLRWLTNVSRYGSPWARAAPRMPQDAFSGPGPSAPGPRGQSPPGGSPGLAAAGGPPEGPRMPQDGPAAGPEPVGPPPEFLAALSRLGRGGPVAAPVDPEARLAELREQAARLRAAE